MKSRIKILIITMLSVVRFVWLSRHYHTVWAVVGLLQLLRSLEHQSPDGVSNGLCAATTKTIHKVSPPDSGCVHASFPSNRLHRMSLATTTSLFQIFAGDKLLGRALDALDIFFYCFSRQPN
jgi:hypothetical protein